MAYAAPAYSFGSYGVNNQLVPLQSAVGVSGGQYVTTPTTTTLTYPYAPPVIPGGSVAATQTMSGNQMSALANPLNPSKGVVWPMLVALIGGVALLDYILYRKG